jgi:hypothetical protein
MKAKVTNPSEVSSVRIETASCLYRLLGFGIEGEVWEGLLLSE